MQNKVLFLIHSLRHGGAERITLELNEYLNDKKVDTKIICWVKNLLFLKHHKYKNAKIIYILKKKNYNFLFDLKKSIKKINVIIKKEKPSLIHVNSTNVLLLLLLSNFNKSIIFLVHGYAFLETKFSFKLIVFRILNIILIRFKKIQIIPVSKKMIPLISKFFLISKKEISSINNGTDINYFKKKKNDLKIIKKIIMIGTLSYHKGQLKGLVIFSKLLKISSNYRLYILGSGPDEEKIKDFIIKNRLKDKIKLIPSTNKVKEYLQKSHLIWTLSESEGMPLSIMEAMSMGVPCIGYNVRGVKEVIKNNLNGFLVDYDDNNKILEKTIQLLTDKSKYKKFSEKSILHINKNYNIQNCLSKHYSLIKNSFYKEGFAK